MPLSITVQANESFPANEAVTLAKLRSAAKPSVAISGAVGSDDLAANSVSGTNIAASSITADKMGLAAITGETGNTTRKGVILVSGTTSTDKQYGELYAGKVNQFLIGTGTVSEGAWTGTYDLKSKALSAASSVEVTAQGDDDFALTIKDDAVVKSMMTNNSVGNSELSGYAVTLNKIAPGGGIAADGGIAENDSSFWGGVLDINPNSKVAGYAGEVAALQPTAANQVIYSEASGARLKFGAHPAIPTAWVVAWQAGQTTTSDDHWNDDTALANTEYKLVAGDGVTSIERTGLGTFKVKFSTGYYSTSEVVKAYAVGFYDYDNVAMGVVGVLDETKADGVASNTITTSNDVQELTVTFYSRFLNTAATSTKRNPTFMQIYFY